MDRVVVETEVHVPPDDAFAFLIDFPGYAKYSDYLRRVEQIGDGTTGTTYELELQWWKLSYTARTEVTGIDEPERIEWRVKRVVTAHGAWEIEAIDGPDGATHSRVRLVIQYDPDSADPGALQVPRFVSLGWIVDRVTPLVREEAERTVERIVADLEGEQRPVELTIRTDRD